MKMTLRTVAEAAGVSIATVDRVLNRREGVRKPTIERVESAIRKLGYSPSSLAARVQPAAKRFAFVLPAANNPFYASLAKAVGELRDYQPLSGSQCEVFHVDIFDPAAYGALLRKLSLRDFDGMAITALDHPSAREEINAIRRKGIPVVTLVSDAPTSMRDRFVGIDNTAAGRTAGALMGRFLPGRSGKVALIAGSLALRDHAERRFGFEQVLAQDFPGVNVVALREGRDNAARARMLTEEILADHPDIAGIYNVGAGTDGVIEALEFSGRSDHITFIAHELTETHRAALIRGTVDAVINQDPGHEARSAARLLMAIACDWPIYDDQERIRIDIYMRDNLE